MINDRYKIIRKVGQGRSSVYLCEDILRPGLHAAIKILPVTAEAEERKSFRDEYFLLKKLNHPNIISVFDYGCVVSVDPDDTEYKIDKASPFFTLEYFEGCELIEFKNLQDKQILTEIICQISSVLYYLHQSAYIYYDLKSENILIKEKEGKTVIKFIDFGLTSSLREGDSITARGTAEYIAPEILRREKIDHRVDLYSFGILLYRVIYGRFPFRNKDQLSIYKAHLDESFDFPDTAYGVYLLNLIQNLLSKEADERFYTSIGIMNEIDHSGLKNYKNEWSRIPVFSGRNDSFSIISAYIEKENSGEVLSIKGAEGAGKSTLLQELNYKYPSSILISSDQNTDYNLWQSLLRGILYLQNIYTGIDQGTLKEAKRILNGESVNLVEDLKAIIIKLISAGRFVLLIDDFNLLSKFDLDIFLQLIPVLQVSKVKIVLTEESSNIYHSTDLNNLQVINLNPFTEIQVTEFVQNSFADFYPKDEIIKAVLLYSDVLPGSIEIFLKDLIVLDILHFTVRGPVLKIDKNLDALLKGSHEDIYRFRFNNLEAKSRDLALFLSLFNVNSDIGTLSQLTGEPTRKLNVMLLKLSEANIIHYSAVFGTVQFTSQGIKEYICSTIEDLEGAHLKIAGLISEKSPKFNTNELARHWELAGRYEQAYETLKEELNKARKTSALSYERNLLEHLSTLPLKSDSLRDIKIELSNCLFQVGELNASIILIDELLKQPRNSGEEIGLKILKGKALIYIQSLEEGKNLLESILNKIENGERRNEILAEIVEAQYEMANYDEADILFHKIIADQTTSAEIKGKVYRIKGLIELYKNNTPSKTIECFENSLKFYLHENIMDKVAAMENNLGNIFNVINEKNKAEEHWNKAIEINNSIGNLLYNGIILLNFGIYYLESCNYEKAVDYYLEAQSIFITLGDKNNLGITYINLGEVFILLCEYEKALDILFRASDIFDTLGNKIEKGEVLLLLGKLYHIIGDFDKLKILVEKYPEFQLTFEKSDFNFQYLKQLNNLAQKVVQNTQEELVSLREKSKTYSDNLLFCEIHIKIIEFLIDSLEFGSALKELNLEEFAELCEKNIYYDAYRNYLMGKVIQLEKKDSPKPFIEYYNKAYSLISEISITELTWKILFELYRVYEDRGNLSQAEEFENYSRRTFMYIIDQMKTKNLREKYMEKPERKFVLKKLGLN